MQADPDSPALSKWQRAGVVVPPFEAATGWSRHCQMPTPLLLDQSRLRIFYTARDAGNRAAVFYVDIATEPPYAVLERPETPCLVAGPLGHFDAAGVMPSSVLRVGDEIWLYTIGWTVRADVPYHNAIGLAVSRDGGTAFTRRFPGPILATTADEPLFCTTPEVVRTEQGWQMFYASTTEWLIVEGKPEPRYHLKRSLSSDGLSWAQHGHVAIDYANEGEGAVARASVEILESGYRMWFCHRELAGYRDLSEQAYRIGVATSADGSTWQRHHGATIFSEDTPPIPGIDDAMQAYPAVINIRGRPVMLYNGNGFGQTGICLATASAD